MPLPCFYVAPENLQHNMVTLSEETSKHVVQVLRMQENEKIKLTDGLGFFYESTIQDANRKKCLVSWQQKIEQPTPDFKVRIAISLIKNNSRFEWFLEKATEMGIDEITPIICAHSERREVKIERLGKRITAAVKQSLKAYHPILNEPILFADFVSENKDCQKFIAHCFEDEKSYLSNLIEKHGRYTILIGPEGDFSPNEIEIALLSEYMPISLGEARLRTETAALASCFEVNYLNR